MVRYASRFKPVAAALAALFATLVLGGFGPGLPGAASLLSWGLFGLATVSGAGLLAWHLAQLTALPQLRTDRFAALLARAGAIAAWGPPPLSAPLAAVTMLGAAWLCRARSPAANDTPSLERMSRFWPMPVPARYARQMPRDSGSEFGE
jgi:hypothetical protein